MSRQPAFDLPPSMAAAGELTPLPHPPIPISRTPEQKVPRGTHIPPSAQYPLSIRQELFAQGIAENLGCDQTALYAKIWGLDLTNPLHAETAQRGGAYLVRQVRVRLRIQQLQEPIVRKIRTKLEYNLQTALEQCTTAHDLALELGDVKSLLKAVELQARLGKLLSETIDVNHRYGVLDDADTETLIEMRKLVEEKRAKKQLAGPATVTIEAESVKEVSRD